MKLCEIAEITAGQIMTRVTDDKIVDGPKSTVLTTKAVDDGFINPADLKEVVLVKSVDPERYTQRGDVMLKLSTPYDAAYINEEFEGLVIPSFFVAIRPKNNVDHRYLTALINSKFFRQQIQVVQTGVGRPMVRISDIRNVEIPDIPLHEMVVLGDEYELSCQKRKLLKEMEETERELMESRVLKSARRTN